MLGAIPFPPISPEIFKLGPLSLKWYGLAYVAGLLFATWYMKRLVLNGALWRQTKPTMTPEQIDNMFIWMFLGVVAGGRLGDVLLWEPLRYAADPLKIFRVWEGGMSFHGGFLGVVVACYFYGRKIGQGLDRMLDLGAASVPVGLGLARVANFINVELFGRVSDVPWAVIFPGDALGRHPTQLYEALLEGLALFVIVRIATHRFQALGFAGRASGFFSLFYGVFRIFVEYFKEPDGLVLGVLTQGMIYSLPMVGVGIWLLLRSRHA